MGTTPGAQTGNAMAAWRAQQFAVLMQEYRRQGYSDDAAYWRATRDMEHPHQQAPFNWAAPRGQSVSPVEDAEVIDDEIMALPAPVRE